MNPIIGALAFALLAAIGNALFAVGQKKALPLDNPFAFIAVSAIFCVTLTLLIAPLWGMPKYAFAVKQNGGWALVSGLGLFLTYVGFYFLYSRYGTSNYILYAVLSIITTSVIVGVWLLRENFNAYHWAALVCALLTVGLFSWGNHVS